MVKLQSIIDAHNLAAINGIHRITAGLPPAYQPCRFKASYASGELLQFTQNNNPEADWAKQTYLAFANWFAEKDVPALLPPQQHFAPVSDFFLKYKDNGRSFTYSPMRVQEKDAISGEQLLLSRAIYDIGAKKSLSRKFILFRLITRTASTPSCQPTISVPLTGSLYCMDWIIQGRKLNYPSLTCKYM